MWTYFYIHRIISTITPVFSLPSAALLPAFLQTPSPENPLVSFDLSTRISLLHPGFYKWSHTVYILLCVAFTQPNHCDFSSCARHQRVLFPVAKQQCGCDTVPGLVSDRGLYKSSSSGHSSISMSLFVCIFCFLLGK